jgi:hypothetical protein
MVTRRVSGRAFAAVVASTVLAILPLSGCAPPASAPRDRPASAERPSALQGRMVAVARPSAGPVLAAQALTALPVKGRAPMTGYRRTAFGPAWADTDRDGCDQRNQVLARDMTSEVFKPRTHNCVVLAGQLADPYTGRIINFRRGPKTSEQVQIDHVVALADAWQTGAQLLSQADRAQLANDLGNLLAVDGPTNQDKGDKDAASWLPPNKRYRCAYVARQVAVKTRYRLWVTAAERDAIARILATCPGEPLPER